MYQERDYEIIDYQLYELPGTGYRIRGPSPPTLAPREYFSCIGAAQTFGCFCERPYPALLAESLGLGPLNLGFAGAGPRLFVHQPRLLDYVNAGRFAIVQVMSARSEDNSRFDSGGQEYLTRRVDGVKIGAEPAYRELLENESMSMVATLVQETRENWIESYTRLFHLIEVPTILFWFSTRSPEYQESYSGNIYEFFGEYPQLVTSWMVDRIKSLADYYVECISNRGLPQPLISRFTGEPATVRHRADLGGGWDSYNPYYPSPQMQVEAAHALSEAARAISAPARR
jgi:hypothetical protein